MKTIQTDTNIDLCLYFYRRLYEFVDVYVFVYQNNVYEVLHNVYEIQNYPNNYTLFSISDDGQTDSCRFVWIS